jgi:hypothetical protein
MFEDHGEAAVARDAVIAGKATQSRAGSARPIEIAASRRASQ